MTHPRRQITAYLTPEVRAKRLCHALRRRPLLDPEEATALIAEEIRVAVALGVRDPEADCFAVLRQAAVDALWALEISSEPYRDRVLAADTLLRQAVARVDGEEPGETRFREEDEDGP